MCLDPVSMSAALGISASTASTLSAIGTFVAGVTSVFQMTSQAVNAQRAADAEAANYLARAKAAKQQYEMQANQLTMQQNEINLQSAVDEMEITRQARRDMARLRVATGESGVGGALTDVLQQGVAQKAGWETGKVKANRESKIAQAQYEKQVERKKAEMPALVQNRASWGMTAAGAVLGIGSAAANAAGKFKSTRPTGITEETLYS